MSGSSETTRHLFDGVWVGRAFHHPLTSFQVLFSCKAGKRVFSGFLDYKIEFHFLSNRRRKAIPSVWVCAPSTYPSTDYLENHASYSAQPPEKE